MGPLTGGVLLYYSSNIAYPFVIVTSLYVITVVMATVMIEPKRFPVISDKKPEHILVDSQVIALCGVGIFVEFSLTGIESVFPTELKRNHEATPLKIGAIFGISILVSVLSSVAVGYAVFKRPNVKVPLMATGIVAFAVLIPILIHESIEIFSSVVILLGFFSPFLSVVQVLLMNERLHHLKIHYYGAGSALVHWSKGLGSLLGPLLLSIWWEQMGPVFSLLLNSGLILVLGGFFVLIYSLSFFQKRKNLMLEEKSLLEMDQELLMDYGTSFH
jgi:MFS family permease